MTVFEIENELDMGMAWRMLDGHIISLFGISRKGLVAPDEYSAGRVQDICEKLGLRFKARNMAVRTWKVYGVTGHRQRESFNKSYIMNFSMDDEVRIIEVLNSDVTGTNDYTIVRIIRSTAEECEKELEGQISDGIFENSHVGSWEEVR